jgi:tetratricopeptide (TPR) repeat protein
VKGILPVLLFAVTLLQTAGAQMSSPRFRLAQSLLNNDQYQEALVIYQELYQSQPDNIFVIKGLQECYRELQQFEQLIELLTRVSRRLPSDINWQINLAEAYYLNDDQATANEIWYRIIDHQPQNILVYRKVAGSMISQRLLDQAIDVYLAAQQNISGQDNLNIDIANLYKLQMAYGQAARHYLAFYAANPGQQSFVRNQILALTDEAEKVPEILAAIAEYSRQHPEEKAVAEIKAGIYIKLGDYEHALESYRSLEDEKSGGAYLVRFAVAARSNGAYAEALKAYRMVLEMYPALGGNGQIVYDMANCYKNLSGPDNLLQAVAIYDSLADAGVTAPIKLASLENLGDIYRQKYFDLDRAQHYYDRYLKAETRVNNRDRVLIKLGDVHRTRNDLDMAQRAYQRVATTEYRYTADFKIAELTYFRGQFRQAESNFDQLLRRVGTNHALTNDILGYLSDIRTYSEDSLALAEFSRAQLLQLQEKKSESARIFNRLVTEKSPLHFRALTSGVTNYLDLGNFTEALELLIFYQSNWPEDLNMDVVVYWQAVTADRMNDHRTALGLYQSILTRFPNSLHAEEARSRARALDQMLKKEQS